jgi:hypothetical protein
MSSTDDDYEDDEYDDTGVPVPWTLRVKEAFWPSGTPFLGSPAVTAADIIPEPERKAAMRDLTGQEVKWCSGALALAALAGVAIPAIFTAENKVTKHGHNSIAVAPDAWLLGGLVLLLCALGVLALWFRKRTLLCFILILAGFALTPFVQLGGFLFIFLGAWLLLRAWRMGKYGTTNSKLIRQEVASRPRGKAAGAAKASSSTSTSKDKGKPSSQPGVRKPPTASKRYTPKSPPRKKIPKPTQ